MKDSFDRKREMVQALQEALKKSAGDEMSSAMGHPHMEDLTKTNAMQQKTSDSSKMSDGGMASPMDEPERLLEVPMQDANGSADSEALSNLPTMPEDEDMEKDDMQMMHNEDNEMEDQDNNSSAFDAFMPRKKKK